MLKYAASDILNKAGDTRCAACRWYWQRARTESNAIDKITLATYYAALSNLDYRPAIGMGGVYGPHATNTRELTAY